MPPTSPPTAAIVSYGDGQWWLSVMKHGVPPTITPANMPPIAPLPAVMPRYVVRCHPGVWGAVAHASRMRISANAPRDIQPRLLHRRRLADDEDALDLIRANRTERRDLVLVRVLVVRQ